WSARGARCRLLLLSLSDGKTAIDFLPTPRHLGDLQGARLSTPSQRGPASKCSST
ncbi:hypothetical protein BCR35DRAFT_306001, partial [Leucosporidium creatinivorum]